MMNGKKRGERTNAKSVEVLDQEGTVLGLYPSGIAVANALGIQQGDVSLCCRGLKHSVGNYRFRFYGVTEDMFEVVKRRKLQAATATIVNPQDDLVMGGNGRTRRVSRGDYHVKVSDKDDFHMKKSKNSISGPKLTGAAHIKVRKWDLKPKQMGTLVIKKWVPETAEATAELREYLPSKKSEARKNKSGRRTNVALQSRY